MILILFGTIISSLFGFKAQELIPKTESFQIQNILMNGQLTKLPIISARINDFWITYTKARTVAQFYSDVSILNSQGTEQLRKTISVNYPLIYKGVYYYQTDWDLLGLRFKNRQQEILEYRLRNIANNSTKIWITWISNDLLLTNGKIVIIDNLEGYCSIYDETGNFLGNIELNETIPLNSSITLVDIISSTGLQIKMDPGIPLIYTGFFFLMASTLISYVSYSHIWFIQNKKTLFISVTLTSALFNFAL